MRTWLIVTDLQKFPIALAMSLYTYVDISAMNPVNCTCLSHVSKFVLKVH